MAPVGTSADLAGEPSMGLGIQTDSKAACTRTSLGASLSGAALVLVLGTAWVDPRRLPLLLIPASFLLLAYRVGGLVGRVVGGIGTETDPVRDPPAITRVAMQLGVGTACLSLLAWGTAFAGLFWCAGLVALFLLAHGLWVGSHRWLAVGDQQELVSHLMDRRVLMAAAGGGAVGVFWLIAWLWATIPPTFFDELSYHLVVPQRALLTGGLPETPWVFFTVMPHASDLLLGWGMAFAGEHGARATHFALWVACSIGAWGMVEALAWTRPKGMAATLAIGALATSPTLWFLATLPFADTCLSLATITALLLLVASPSDRRPWIALGLVLGLAATVKLTGLYWVAAGLAAAAVAGWPLKDLARAAMVAVGSVAPWWGRALLQTGNPIYPMAYDVLGGRYWSPESQARAVGDVAPSVFEFGLSGLLRLPADLVQHPERFGSGGEAGIFALVATAGLVVWPLVARMIRTGPRERQRGDLMATFVLVAGIGWLATSTTIRFLAPALLLGLAALAGAVLYLDRIGRSLALVALLAASIWGTWEFLAVHSAAFSSTGVALGQEPPEAYLSRQLEHFDAARFVQQTLPQDAKLLFIGETRPYYFFREALAPTAYDQHPLQHWVQEAASPQALAARLAQEGFTHVVLNVREYNRLHRAYGLFTFSGPNQEADDQRLKRLPQALSLQFSKNGVLVFEIPSDSEARRAGQGRTPNGPEGQPHGG